MTANHETGRKLRASRFLPSRETAAVCLITLTIGITAGVFLLENAGRRGRRESNDIVCSLRLALIGEALTHYAADHQGRPAPDLESLARDGYIQQDCLICPFSGEVPIRHHNSPDTEGISTRAFYYIRPNVASGRTSSAPLVLSPIERVAGYHYVIVLFQDGSRKTIGGDEADALLDDLEVLH